MSTVHFTGVTKRYGAVVALGNLDLAIEDGEFVALLGPSGSGKSTSLNLLAGLADPDEGEIRIGEKVVNHLPPDRRNLAMVFQSYALYPHMTVFENIAFPLRARGRRLIEAAIAAKVEAVAALLGVAALLHRYPRELSGGQQQRVALGRAMVRDPEVFLLDEPLSNLDARLRIRMRRDIKALHQQLKSTIVYVTHDQSEAMTLSSRIAIFNQGQLQQFASPADIYNRPANMFVANFVGDREINFFDADLRERGGRLVAEAGQAVFPLEMSPARAPANGRAVKVGIRPEAIVAGGGEQAHVQAVVSQIELIGPDLIIYAATADLGEMCVRLAPDATVAIGDKIGLTLQADQIHLFDPDTTAALRRHERGPAAGPASAVA